MHSLVVDQGKPLPYAPFVKKMATAGIAWLPTDAPLLSARLVGPARVAKTPRTIAEQKSLFIRKC
jgi:hypothetical protein